MNDMEREGIEDLEEQMGRKERIEKIKEDE